MITVVGVGCIVGVGVGVMVTTGVADGVAASATCVPDSKIVKD